MIFRANVRIVRIVKISTYTGLPFVYDQQNSASLNLVAPRIGSAPSCTHPPFIYKIGLARVRRVYSVYRKYVQRI